MLENTVKWRREFRPDQLDEKEIRPEVKKKKNRRGKYAFMCVCIGRDW